MCTCSYLYTELTDLCLFTAITAESSLTLDLVMAEVSPRTNKWQLIALHLDMVPVVIERIDRKERGDTQQCFHRIFEKWQKQLKPPFRWEEIIDALNSPSVGQHVLAKHLEEKYVHCTVAG